MSTLLLRNCDVLTLDESNRLLRGVSIWIEDGVIQSIGPEPMDLQLPPSQVFNARGCLAMPGFWNAQAQAGTSLLHSQVRPPFPSWLQSWSSENPENSLTDNQVRAAAYHHACQMIRNGVVGVGELSPHLDQVLPVFLESGLKAGMGWSSYQMEWDYQGQAEQSVEWAISHRNEGSGRIKTAIGYRGLHRCSEPFVVQLAQRAHAERLAIWTDLPGDDASFNECIREEENDPVAILQQKGAFGTAMRLNYITHLERWNFEGLQHTASHLVMKPSSQTYRTQRPLQWKKLLELGLPVAIGTEPSALNRQQSVLRELKHLLWTAEVQQEERSPRFHETLLRLGTAMGARVLGFEDSGMLSPGMSADIALVDMDQTHLQMREVTATTLLEQMQDGDVRHLLGSGRWLLKNGEMQTLDEERILWEARQCQQS